MSTLSALSLKIDSTDTNITGTQISSGSSSKLQDVAVTEVRGLNKTTEDGAQTNLKSSLQSDGPIAEQSKRVLEGAPEMTEDMRNLIRQELRSGRFDIPAFKDHQSGDLPAVAPLYHFSLDPPPHQSIQYRDRTCRPFPLPQRNQTFSTQIVEHIGDWAEWGTRIPNEEKRKEALDRVYDALTKVWFEALRLGYTSSGGDGQATLTQPRKAKEASSRFKKAPLHLPHARPRQKRETSPSRRAILTSRSHADGPGWAVSAGELQEAGISEKRIRHRVAAGNLQDGEALLQETIETLGGVLTPKDWNKVTDVTKANFWGRDLCLYALYEVMKSRESLAHLQELYSGFTGAKQKENTQRRIDEEQERHDLFMALALEIKDPGSSLASDEQSSRGGSIKASDELGEISNQLRSFIQLLETVLEEPDISQLATLFEQSPFSNDSLLTDMPDEKIATNLDQSKQALSDLLLYTNQIERKTSDQESQISGFEASLDQCAEIQNLEEKVREQKDALRYLLPLLSAECDAATINETCQGRPVDTQDVVEEEIAPPSNKEPSVDESALSAPSVIPAKRSVDEDDEVEMPSRKKSKTTNGHESSTATGEGDKEELDEPLGVSKDVGSSDAAISPSESSVQLPGTKKRLYFEAYIFPKVNQLLAQQGTLPVTDTRWAVLRETLKQAGASTEQRNELARKINEGMARAWEMVEEDTQQVLPQEGNSSPRNLDEPGQRSLIVSLRHRSPFDPSELSSKALLSHKGFQYRYTPESTLAQRQSMDDILNLYVRELVKHKGKDSSYRFGSYVVLTHPDDPERTSIIHGVWDERDGSRAEEHSWFYEGSSPPVPAPDQEQSVVNNEPKNTIRLKRNDSTWTVNTPSNPLSSKKTGTTNKGRTASSPTSKSPRSSSRATAATGSSSGGSRPKRRAARKSYADLDDDEDDEEYRPSD